MGVFLPFRALGRATEAAERKKEGGEGGEWQGGVEMLQAAKLLRVLGAELTLCCPPAGAARLGSPHQPRGTRWEVLLPPIPNPSCCLAEGETESHFTPKGAVPTRSPNSLSLPLGVYELLAHLFKEHQQCLVLGAQCLV